MSLGQHHQYSPHQGQFYCAAKVKNIIPALLSAAAGEGQGQLSLTVMTLVPDHLTATDYEEEGKVHHPINLVTSP